VSGGKGGVTWPSARGRGCLAALVCLLAFPGCAGLRLQSAVRDRLITIDGRSDEWQEDATFIKQSNLSIALFNDGQDLYLGITSWNQELNAQVETLGLTIWFDPTGREERAFGVEYPLVDRVRSGPDAPRLAVRGPGPGDRHALTPDQAAGIEVSSATVSGAMVYELRVPLERDARHPFAIDAVPGRPVGILLETPRVEPFREDRREARGEGEGPRAGVRGGGTGGGGGRGMRGGGGGAGRGARRPAGEAMPDIPKPPKPFRIAVKARLAPVAPVPAADGSERDPGP
jgi:hypothetical protein